MGKKYSINSAGRIVAERDIYSLGGFIPKGTVGGSVKDETQLSQEGECWLASGDISARPDIRIKDNAYIGTFTPGVNPVHTDGITEFSGNTLIPGNLSIRCFTSYPKNNIFIKDSFIGISMDVLCGPRTTATAFPFEQGGYLSTAPRGTAFSSSAIQTKDTNLCRSTDAVMRCGLNTYVYLPTGYSGRILWAYTQGGTAVYSGESKVIPSGLTKIEHPVYKQFMLHINKINGTAMTPADLLATGAKILGNISGSLLQDFRPESVSGEYAIVNSSLIAETDNFGLAITQVRFLAGGMYNTNMYTKTNRQDYKPYGTFRNVGRLEYIQYFADVLRGNANRDHFVVASDCPLVRISDKFVSTDLVNAGGVTLRNCIVPKAVFKIDAINGNTYEDLDFSYANEHLESAVAQGGLSLSSSHREGLYAAHSAGINYGLVSRPDNAVSGSNIGPDLKRLPLDGNIIEQGTYTYTVGGFYEDLKTGNVSRLRTGKPLPTENINVFSLPSGWKITSLMYLDNEFKIRGAASDPTGTISKDYPFFLVHIGKDPEVSTVSVSEFIALNVSLTQLDYTKIPEITGSAYVGAGCTVRGDVQLQGDPYVNRVLDVNLWEWGSISEGSIANGWNAAKNPSGGLTDVDRRRLKEVIPVEPGAKITCNSGYWVNCYFYDYEGNYISSPGWGQVASTAPDRAAFAGVILKKSESASGTGYIEDSDIPLANVKYLRAFKKRRYITNELDRTSPEDVFLSEDQWRVAAISTGSAYVGRIYESLIQQSNKWCILKRPINAGASWTVTLPEGVGNVYSQANSSWDASTKLLGLGVVGYPALTGLEFKKVSGGDVTLKDVPAARFIVEFVPSPRIINPYGASGSSINGVKIRMYDNSVLSKNINNPEELILKGDAVVSHLPSGCVCGWGDYDAIVKL